jgi:hypothetical protein
MTRIWDDKVYGVWKDISFLLYAEPDWDGTVRLSGYTYNPKAGKLGMRGDQYNGWDDILPADEVVLTYHEIDEYPMDIPLRDIRREDIKVTRIYFDPNGDELPANT